MEQQMQNDVASRQRIVRSEEEILRHLDEQEKSGFTVKEYCELSEINDATFYSWIKKYRNQPEDDAKGFAQIEVIPTMSNSRPQLFAEVGNIKLYKEVSAEYLKALLS